LQRAQHTQRAAEVFAEHAEAIVASTQDLPAEHVSVAVVHADFAFAGTHLVPRADLVERVPTLEGPGGWAMVFSHGADVAQVQARTQEMSDLAERRRATLARVLARRSDHTDRTEGHGPEST
jgi:hypothetical protein